MIMQTIKKSFNRFQQKQFERYAEARRVDLPKLINHRYSIEFSGNANNLDARGHGLRLGLKDSNGEPIWLANGTVVGNAVQVIQELDRLYLNKVTSKNGAIDVIESFATQNITSTFDKSNLTTGSSKIREFRLTSGYRDTTGIIYEYIKSRGISRKTIDSAREAGFLDKTSSGIRFVGRDVSGNPKNAETRLIEPKKLGDKSTKFICTPGSDRSYPPILPGCDHGEIHIVEGGFSALGLKEIMNRQGRSPTIIVTGGKDNISWLKHSHVQTLIKGAVITLHTENERSPEIQRQADEAIDKQCQAIMDKGAATVIKVRPPEEFKDNADLNKHIKQETQTQQQSLLSAK